MKTPLWIAVCLLIGWGLVVAARGTATATPQERRGSDLQLYHAVTARVAAGENYYPVLADELTRRNYATRPVWNWRLPTLTWLNAIPPSPFWGRALFTAVAATVIAAWPIVIWRSMPRVAIAGAIVVAVSTVPLLGSSDSIVLHEIWSGLLIAASLACWGLGRWKTSVALGAAALMTRELALPYVCIMASLAWWEGLRRETLAWVATAGVFAAFWAGHVSHVLGAMPPEGVVNSWFTFGGWGFALDASQSSILLMQIPERWMLAIVIPVLLAGFWYWSDPLGRRLAVVLGGYFALFTIVGRPDNWYWGFLIGPLIPLGGLGYFFGPKARPLVRGSAWVSRPR